MIPYFALLIIPALVSPYAIRLGKNSRRAWTLSIRRSGESAAIGTFFLLFILLLALRHETIGRDLLRYKELFQEHPLEGFSYVSQSWKEILFRLYNWTFRQLTGDFRIYLVVTTLLTLVPIAQLYREDKSHGYFKVAVFLNMVTFDVIFSAVRQSLAMALGMVAYRLVRERKLGLFILVVAAATLIHHSGFVLAFMYPLYHIRLNNRHLLFVIPAMIGVFVFNRQIFDMLTSILANFTDEYGSITTTTGAYTSLILFVLFAVFIQVVTDKERCDKETLALRNFMLFAVAIQCFAPLHTLAMRINYYYILFIPLALGKALSCPRPSMKQVARVGEIVICVYFTLLFFYTTYQACDTGISSMDNMPYLFFWQNP